MRTGRPSKPKIKCTVDGCERYQYTTTSYGYCRLHLGRYKKYGDTTLPKHQDKICNVEGCGKKQYSLGYCMKHATQFKRNGCISSDENRLPRTGSITKAGYVRIMLNNVSRHEHVWVAMAALGKELPKGAHVHHLDGDKLNNKPSNLVVCPDMAYHMLLEKRGRAYNACGHADWLKCVVCKKYDEPGKITSSSCHLECRRVRSRSIYNKESENRKLLIEAQLIKRSIGDDKWNRIVREIKRSVQPSLVIK